MDVSYERNVTTLLTTIVSNIITITLLGVYQSFKIDSNCERMKKESGAIVPSWLQYLEAVSLLLTDPTLHVQEATTSLCSVITLRSLGIPYKYIRLLSNASYFVGYDSQVEIDEDDQECSSQNNCSLHIDNDQTDGHNVSADSIVQIDTHESDTGITQLPRALPKVWLPKDWPEEVKEEKGLQLWTSPDERYISHPDFDGFYSLKSGMACLFGTVECASTIIISCMRLPNTNMVHTIDVLSMYTSYILLCIVINASFTPSYYCKPVVCIPEKHLKTYTKTIDNRLPLWRLHMALFFGQARGHVFLRIFLLTPICLMVALLIYINKNSTLLLSLSVVWIFATAFGNLLSLFSEVLFHIIYTLQITVTLALFITLIVCSCLNATPEQKYPSSQNWLPHF